MLRRILSDRRDPRVHEFSDFSHADQACAEGRDDELLEAPEAGEYDDNSDLSLHLHNTPIASRLFSNSERI